MNKNYKNLLLLLVLFLTSCGHKTLPSPNVENDIFSWHNINGQIINNTLVISGQALGNINNLSTIKIEVQAITDDCLTCPFIAEYSESQYALSVLDVKTGVFSLNYHLLNSTAIEYRWRIVGINYILGLNNVVSPTYISKKEKQNNSININIQDVDIVNK